MSVKKASKIFQVPDTTLRDRVLQKVDPETAVFGKSPVLECFEEANLVQHFKTMAAYGYGYTRQECVNIAPEYAVHLGKRTMDKPFTMKWMRGFLKRWPELKVLKPRGLEHARAKMASKETGYFKNLEKTLSTHNMHDKPHLIYNVDEKGISIDHKPPSVVSDSTYCPQAVTSGRGKTITILGGGSASGVAIPPFFIFPGKRMRPELLNGASPGTSGTNGQKSHILQPMDVSCYGPLEKIYNNLCHKLMRESSATITRYNVCEVAGKAYTRALSPENIQSGFRKSGIYPLNPEAIRMEYLAPAEVFKQISPITNTTPSEKNTHEDAENLDNRGR
uniref:HTH psq-type domain-containing protein n=1 Tax=Magallana gigas TaxID=29159 RepID=A0A8W8JBF7_MAGGI